MSLDKWLDDPIESFKDFISNGKVSELKERSADLERLITGYNKRVEVFEEVRMATLNLLENESCLKIQTVDLLRALSEKYENIKAKNRLVFDLSPNDLHQAALSSSKLTPEELMKNTIEGYGYAAEMGLKFVGDAAKTYAWFVARNPSAQRQIQQSVSNWLGTQPKSYTFPLLQSGNTPMVNRHVSKVSSANNWVGLTSGGLGALGISAKVVALAAVALPIVALAGIGYGFKTNLDLKEELKKIKEERREINENTIKLNNLIEKCQLSQNEIREKIKILEGCDEKIQILYEKFEENVNAYFESIGFFRSIWAQICLKLGIVNKNLAPIFEAKQKLTSEIELFKSVVQ